VNSPRWPRELGDDETREPCRRVLQAESTESFTLAIEELRTALRDHIAEADNLTVLTLLKLARNKGKDLGSPEGLAGESHRA